MSATGQKLHEVSSLSVCACRRPHSGAQPTCDRGQGVCGHIFSIYDLPEAGLGGVKCVIKPILRPCSCCAVVLEIGCKTLVQPQLTPIVASDQISKPLQAW